MYKYVDVNRIRSKFLRRGTIYIEIKGSKLRFYYFKLNEYWMGRRSCDINTKVYLAEYFDMSM